MDYVHVKKLEQYHPGYKDRTLVWCKTYFSMINSNIEFEMVPETDKWRFICFVMIELQTKKPIPMDKVWLNRKGFDLKKRSISLTLQMLHNFIEVRNENVTQSRVYKEEYIKKSRVENVCFDFDSLWAKYPSKDGKDAAKRHFNNSVKSDNDWKNINKALDIYLGSKRVKAGYIKNGSTWFNNWRDWIEYKDPQAEESVMEKFRKGE